MFGIVESRGPALELTDVLVRAAQIIEESVKNLKKPRPDSDTAEPPTEASPPIPPRRSETPAQADQRHAVRQIPGVTTR